MDKRPVAYLVSEYPKVSHTFILREIAALREQGLAVETTALRTPFSEDLRGEAERAEHSRTFYVQQAGRDPVRLASAHWRALCRDPGRYLSALWTALTDRPPGLKALCMAVAYFAQAGLLAEHLHSRGVRHLHVHFANSGCSVGRLAGAIAGLPFSFTMHGPAEFFDVDGQRLPSKLKEASFVACISYFCRSQLMLHASPSDWGKMHIVRCGIEPGRYHRTKRSAGRHLVFVGRLAAQKGVPVLLRAFADLCKVYPLARLTLVGDGPDRGVLEGLATRLGIAEQVSFVGGKTQDEVADVLSQADLFVLPSFAEGVPVVLMEAMASGLPVVATRIAGVGELVEEGTHGLLVPPGDPRALSTALADLMQRPEDWRAMGYDGRKRVARDFNIKTEAARLAKLLAAPMPAPTAATRTDASPAPVPRREVLARQVIPVASGQAT